MARSLSDRRVQEWRQRFRRFEKSRQSIRAVCVQEGVSPPSFYLWRRRFHAASAAESPVPSAPEGLRTVIDALARVDAQRSQGVRPC